jgi:hypothetical protein
MLIKENNVSCISFTEASVNLQDSEIRCLTDASVSWRKDVPRIMVPVRAICTK